jgi:hypothetical protein
MRKLVAPLAAVAVAFVFAGNALASVNFVTLNSKATLAGGSVIVSGTTLCTTGDTANATVILTQTNGQSVTTGTGSSGDFTCTGTYQAWSVVVSPVLGPGFRNGKASVSIAEVNDSTDHSFTATTGVVHVG